MNMNPSDNDLGNWKLTQMIRPYLIKGGLSIVSRYALITFPAGANDIIYQPTFGFGSGPNVPDPEPEISPAEEQEIEREAEAAQTTKTIEITGEVVGGVLGFLTVALIGTFLIVKYARRKNSPSKKRTTTDEDVEGQPTPNKVPTSSYQSLP